MCSMYENIDDGAFVGRKQYYVLMLRLTFLGLDYYINYVLLLKVTTKGNG